MSEEFNIDLELDEAAEARIAHADYLNRVKDWSQEMAELLEPLAEFSRIIIEQELDKNTLEHFIDVLPHGAKKLVEHINLMYSMMQHEAVSVLGAPFKMQEIHHPQCGEILADGEEFVCGHQDHYLPKTDK